MLCLFLRKHFAVSCLTVLAQHEGSGWARAAGGARNGADSGQIRAQELAFNTHMGSKEIPGLLGAAEKTKPTQKLWLICVCQPASLES